MRYIMLGVYVLLAAIAVYRAGGKSAQPDPWFASRALPQGHQLLRSDLVASKEHRSLERLPADSLVGKHLTRSISVGDTLPLTVAQSRPVTAAPPVGYADLRTLLTAQELEMIRGLTVIGDSLTVCALAAGKDKPSWMCETCGTVATLHGAASDSGTGWLVLRVHAEHLERATAVVAGEKRLFATRNVPRSALPDAPKTPRD